MECALSEVVVGFLGVSLLLLVASGRFQQEFGFAVLNLENIAPLAEINESIVTVQRLPNAVRDDDFRTELLSP